MKKIGLLCTLLIVLLLTGCESDIINNGDIKVDNGTRLSCNQKVQTVDVKMIADFKDDKLTYLGLEYGMDLSSYTDTQVNAIQKEDMCTIVKNSMSNYSDAFTNCKQSVENKQLLITADFDLDKLKGADLTTQTSIDEAKTELEKQGYSCTITKK